MNQPASPDAAPAADPRFTMGLYFDVVQVLKRHGYAPAENPASSARALVELLHLTEAYEGRDGAR